MKIKYERDKGVKPKRAEYHHPKITPEIIDDRVWYALRVVSQREFVAQNILKIRGLLTYVPVRKEWRHKNRYDRAKRVKQEVSYPEMTGYVLIGFLPGQISPQNVPHWLKIFSIPIVLSVVGINKTPISLDRASLKRIVQKYPNGMQKPRSEAHMRTHHEFKTGDMVRVCNGPFDGHIVPVTEIRGHKAKFSLDVFGAVHDVEIDCYDLEKAA